MCRFSAARFLMYRATVIMYYMNSIYRYTIMINTLNKNAKHAQKKTHARPHNILKCVN